MFASGCEEERRPLRASVASFQALFEQAPMAIQICALDGSTLRVNDAYRELWGCDPAADANILEGTCVIHPDLGPLLARAFGGESVYSPPTHYSAQQVPLLPKGYTRWVETYIYPVTDGAGAIQQVIVVFGDVTDRVQAQELLRESERRFRSAFEHAAFGMALIGTDGRFLQVNPSLCRMLGYTQQELTELSFQQLTWEEDLPVDLDLFDDLVSGRRDYGWLEKRYVHKDGHPVWTLLSTAAVRDQEGALLYMISQIQDISLAKQATLAVLEERQRIARELHDSVSQALYGIGLGARTARALLDRDPAQAVEPIEYILSLAEAGLAEMRALIFELLPDALRQEGLIVALSRRTAALQARHNLHVEQDLCPEPDVPVEAKEALYRVAQEALNNIAKHARARQVTIRLAEHGGQLALSIADDGIGFEPQADYPGHIGLRTMRQRIEQLGGRFEIHSAPGQGSHLQVAVPIPRAITPG